MAGPELRRGWTTGACATAAATAAFGALLGRGFADPVAITLPRGLTPAFRLSTADLGDGWATAGVVKDAGDDPDVTHGLEVRATVRREPGGDGPTFRAGPGVGTVTLPGLPLAVGEPAINPGPRRMLLANLARVAGVGVDELPPLVVEVSIPGGDEVAHRTWNPRLGILGGLSVLGTTGVVVPYSCSAWIHSIHRGVDVARATGAGHVAGCTGSTSEAAVQARHGLPDTAMLDMGDFAGGLLGYLRRHPVARLTVGGGPGKLSKLARGHLDLHSARSEVDLPWLVDVLGELLADAGGGAGPQAAAAMAGAAASRTALGVLDAARTIGLDHALAERIARAAAATCADELRGAPVDVDVVVVDREGAILAEAAGPPRAGPST